MTPKTRIMIVAGEASGDMHGANLIRAIREIDPEIEVAGIGGPALAEAGVSILFDAAKLAVIGLLEVLHHLADIRLGLKTVERYLRKKNPDLVILIDFPDFNFMVAKKAKKLGIPVFYYISPQVWAWRSGRVRTIARLVNRMAVILPFEEEFYRQKGMEVDFVGHPLVDTARATMSREEFLVSQGIDPAAKVVGILPGSRRKELSSMLPVFLETAEQLAAQAGDAKLVFLLPLAPTLTMDDLDANGLAGHKLDLKVIKGDRYNLMASCDAVLAASGTVTLELAILKVPMVVAYKVSPLTHFLGSWLIKVKFAALVNLIEGREVVKELLQDDATPERIAPYLHKLVFDSQANRGLRQELDRICKKLGGPGASARAAACALKLIKEK